MKKFESKVSSLNGVVKIELSGDVTAQSTFPPVDPSAKEFNVLLENVTYVNSGGVREWMNWVSEFSTKAPGARLVFDGIPPALTRQFVAIESLIPDHSQIKSVFVLYYCEKCDNTIPILYQNKGNLNASPEKMRALFETATCPNCGSVMESDADPESYVKLLQKYSYSD